MVRFEGFPFPGIPTTIQTMGVNITTIACLRVLIIEIGQIIILTVVEAQGLVYLMTTQGLPIQKEWPFRWRSRKTAGSSSGFNGFNDSQFLVTIAEVPGDDSISLSNESSVRSSMILASCWLIGWLIVPWRIHWDDCTYIYLY